MSGHGARLHLLQSSGCFFSIRGKISNLHYILEMSGTAIAFGEADLANILCFILKADVGDGVAFVSFAGGEAKCLHWLIK